MPRVFCGDRRVKWILVDLWARGCLIQHLQAPARALGKLGILVWLLQPHPELHDRACVPASASSAQSPGSWLGTSFISSFWKVPGCGAGSRMAPFCRPGWGRRGCCVRDSVPELRALRSCWEPGLPSEAVPAAAGALVCIAHECGHYSILAVGTGVSPVMPGLCPALQIYSLFSCTLSKIHYKFHWMQGKAENQLLGVWFHFPR